VRHLRAPCCRAPIETQQICLFVNFENLTPRRGGVQNLIQNLHAEAMDLNRSSVARQSKLGNFFVEISFSNSKNKKNKKVFWTLQTGFLGGFVDLGVVHAVQCRVCSCCYGNFF